MTVNRGLWPWLFQRLTAAFLVVGVGIHFVVLHFLIERPVTLAKIAERLQSPAWVFFDVLLLLCALYHALNGLYGVLLDFSPPQGLKRWSLWMLWAVGSVAALVGVVNLLPFAR
ncbi:MAG: succinate dehydrogenase [Deltaproteobacteria bacterium]|nr:succinate dehydrogenase [Deltaproteobacteria bacterium]